MIATEVSADMGQVNVTISGKSYRMACDDGQEDHLTDLAQRLSDTIEQLRSNFGEIGDQRLTVMAALTMADQTSELERRLHNAEAELASMQDAEAATADLQNRTEGNVANVIESVAVRLEAIAERLDNARSGDDGG